MPATRVMVTGMGVLTPLGGDVTTSWAALRSGCSGVRALTGPEYRELPVRIAAPLAEDPDPLLSRVERRRWDRSQRIAILAARQAWADAGFTGTAADAGLEPQRVGVVVGTGIGGITTTLDRYQDFLTRGWIALSPYTVTMTMPNGPAATISQDVGARGGAHAPTAACATGAEALGQAAQMIRSGRCDVVLAGGVEAAIHPFTMAGFAAMRALSRRNDDPAAASRPFDADRDGFVFGEGAGVLVVESAEHAQQRRASGYAELAGVGFASDPYHITRGDPTGVGPQSAMRRALADAGGTPADVVHINAHATATPVGDLTEAQAIADLIGPRAVVSATKSQTGHTLGAAGAIEAVFTILALRDGMAPATLNLDHVDPAVDLTIARGSAQPLPADSAGISDGSGISDGAGRPALALSNSFGFGGHNVTLAFRRA